MIFLIFNECADVDNFAMVYERVTHNESWNFSAHIAAGASQVLAELSIERGFCKTKHKRLY